MKRVIYAAALLAAITSASADEYWSTPVGLTTVGGERELKLEPRSAIEVNITIRKESFTAGIYARYAQKYLGVRASLADRSGYSVVDGSLSLATSDYFISSGEPLAPSTSDEQADGLAVDITSSQLPALEQAAANAAATIFKIRQNRMDLISGDVGEGVFGAGLATAIATYDRMEQQYLELFMGKTTVSESHHRYIIYPKSESKAYNVARFSADRGLLPLSDLTGDPIYLQITPSENPKLEGVVDESLPALKDQTIVTFAVANLSSCMLSLGSEEICSVQMPLYEFGQSAKYSVRR